MKASLLFREWLLAGLKISNRIVMAPMSTNRVDQFGYVTPCLIDYLKRRARDGCGMIIVESATVEANLGSGGRNLRIDNEACVTGLQELVHDLHSFGTVVVSQLWHAGPRAYVNDDLPLSPSGTTEGFPVSRALGSAEVQAIVQYFIQAGNRAARAGFDALEVHAAHGYLLHHFIDRVTNRRCDDYGGSLERRYRILVEIRAGLRSFHPKLPVILRLSLRSDDDFPAIAQIIQEAGFDAVDVRTGFSSMPKADAKTPIPAGYTLNLVRELRSYLKIPLMTGGRIITPEDAEQALAEYGLDAIVLGRPLLADSEWVRKASLGQVVVPCQYDCTPSCYSKFKDGELLRCVYYERQE